LVEGAGEKLHGVFIPQAAELLNGGNRCHVSTRALANSRTRHLTLSGQTLNGRGRRKPAHGCNVAWPSDSFENDVSDMENDTHEYTTGDKHSRSRSGNPRPGIGSAQSYNKRLTFVGRGPALSSLDDGPICELAAKMGGINVDLPSVSMPGLENSESKVPVEGSRKKISSTHVKRSLVNASESETKAAVNSGANRSQEAHPLSAESLEVLTVQSPTRRPVSSALTDDFADERPLETMISRRPASSPCQTISQSSPHLVRGRPPLNRMQSAPQVVAEGAVNYVAICHRVGSDALAETEAAATAVEMPEASASTCNSASVVRREEWVQGPSGCEALPNRPGTTGSSMLGGRRGMPLGASPGPLGFIPGSPNDNLFGVVSRSRNFSQGSPTELGPALTSSPSQTLIARSKTASNVRSSSSAGRLRSGASHCPAVVLSASATCVASGRGLPQ
jgi:hypothetical protein